MDSLNWYLIAALGSASLLLGLVLVSRRQRRQPSALVALVTQRRSLRGQLVKLLGSDEAAQAAAQDEARRLNRSKGTGAPAGCVAPKCASQKRSFVRRFASSRKSPHCAGFFFLITLSQLHLLIYSDVFEF